MMRQTKSIFIRFNMEDERDRELYGRLVGEAGSSASLAAFAKKTLEERFALNMKIADRQEFHRQMLSIVREEMRSQGMQLVGALLSGMGKVAAQPTREDEADFNKAGLPEACGELPEELGGVLDFIR